MKFVTLLCFAIALAPVLGEERDPLEGLGPNPAEGFVGDTHRFVFFAVLEGCYNDGLLDQEIDQIIPKLKDGRRDTMQNFVLSCPLCGPASDAFCLYAGRKSISRQRDKTNRYRTFGVGIDAAVKAELKKPGAPCRDAIQGMIQEWIEARIVNLRLTDAETKALRTRLSEMRKEGDRALARFKKMEKGSELSERYRDWGRCPICAGASPMAGE